MTTYGAMELGAWPTLSEARGISRKLNDRRWMDDVLAELGEAITFAKDHHKDWKRVLIDTFGKGLPWGSDEGRDTLIKFLKDHGLSVRTTEALLVPPVSRGRIWDRK
jgi:hypothetical protein